MSARFVVVVSVIIERDGRVLLLRRSRTVEHAPGRWDVASGRLEAGETPKDAARREAAEETGLSVDILEPLDTFFFRRGPARDEAIGITFCSGNARGEVTLSAEHDEARWVALDELGGYEVAPGLRRCIELVLGRAR